MRMGKYGHELDLLLLLTENKDYSTSELAEKLNITRRNLYYYLDYLKCSGFHLIKTGTKYRLDRTSSFFKKLHESISLSSDEALYLYRKLEGLDSSDFRVKTIKAKLERYYNLDTITNVGLRKRFEHNAALLREAIEQRKIVCLKQYASAHSKTVSDRLVEPFLFLNNDMDIRCYELATHCNKTFKTSRVANVELTDVNWIHEKRHKALYTDIFMFSGEERELVTLRLGSLSHSLLLEEYPLSEPYITPADEPGTWLFQSEVVSFLGIGRFVLGLYDDIQVLGNTAFQAYITDKIKKMQP